MPKLSDLDIREGDILTVDMKDYPVKFIETWESGLTRGSSFRRMATKTASVSRDVASGKNYTRAVVFESISCTPLDPLTRDVGNLPAIEIPYKMLQTIITGNSGFYRIVVEDLK